MRIFVAHLRKEWREHRAVLLGVAIAIPFLLAVGCAASTGFAYGMPIALPWVLAGGTALTALALATELWPGESRRDGLALLRRTPGGVRGAFAAKTTFFVAAGAATTAWTAAAAVAAAGTLAGAATCWETWLALHRPEEFAGAGAVLVAGLWAILASTWVPRGAAAVGLGVLLLGALVAPAALVLDPYEWEPLAGELPAWVVLLLAVTLPVLAAYASLRGALDRGRGHARACLLGVATVLAVAMPAYAWGAMRLDAWRALDPDDPDFQIVEAVVARDGRYAYLSVARRATGHGSPYDLPTLRPWRVDLETGRWTEIGPLGDCVVDRLAYDSVRPTAGIVEVLSARNTSGTVTWWDAARGERWRTFPANLRPAELIDRLRDDLRRTSPVRRPDGSRAWAIDPRAGVHDVRADRVEWDVPGEGVAFAGLDDVRVGWTRRTGWTGYRRAAQVAWEAVEVGFDATGKLQVTAWKPTSPKTRRVVPLSADAALEGPASTRTPGTADGWVIRRADGSASPLASIRPEDHLLAVLGPSTVLASRQESQGPRRVPFLVDVFEDRVRSCVLPGPLAEAGVAEMSLAGWTPSDEALLRLQTVEGSHGLARLAVETGTVHSWVDGLVTNAVWFVDDESAIAWVGPYGHAHTLARIDWRTGTTRQVFPRR